jgi:hypothetical protein
LVLSRLPGACALALVIACTADFCVAGPQSPVAMLCTAGLAVVVGFGFGSTARLALWLLGWLPRVLALVAWPLATLATAAWVATRLGAFKRLHGNYGDFAIVVLVTCGSAAIACSLLLCALQPTGTARRAALPDASRRARGLLASALVLVVCGLAVADRTLYVDLYSIGHSALRVGVLALATIALALGYEWCRVPMPSRPVLIGIALACAGLPIALDEQHPAVLQALLARPWPAFALGAARGAVDVDRDGYASLLGGGDCAPFDRRVHPGAREVPENGIDDNCALGDARRRLAASASAVMPSNDSPLDVVLITVDSLRRDRVGSYAKPSSGERVLTPNLDRWAAGATIFDHAYAPGGWTSLSVPALMRGVYPRRLRWTRFYETSAHRLLRAPLAPQLRAGEIPTWLFAFPANDGYRPLAEWLSLRGMSTLAVVDDGRSEILRPGTGIERGFREYIEVNPGALAVRDDAATTTRAIAALSREHGTRGVFLWVHFFGIHSPSESHAGTPRYGSSVADRYDHEVRFFDTQLARLLAALEHRGRPTAVFLSADHGEELESRVRHHGYSVAEEVISVPLVAHVPGWNAGHVRALVNLVDLLPTILTLTRTPLPAGLDGIDLGAAIRDEAALRGRVVLSDTWRFDVEEHLVADMVAAYDGRHKLVVDELGYGSYLSDQTQPALPPVLRFGATLDRLSRAAYGYLEDTGGMPTPSD